MDRNTNLKLQTRIDELKKNPPEYAIGVDTYTGDSLAYCLVRRFDESTEVILAKTLRDKKEFKQEVQNLAKYFNATILGEVD